MLTPEQKLSYLRQILQLSETRNTKIVEAEERYSTDLRQILDNIIGKNGLPTEAPSSPTE